MDNQGRRHNIHCFSETCVSLLFFGSQYGRICFYKVYVEVEHSRKLILSKSRLTVMYRNSPIIFRVCVLCVALSCLNRGDNEICYGINLP